MVINADRCLEVYFDDLNSHAQRDVIAVFGDNNNFDVFPLAVIPIPEDGGGE